MEGVEAEEGTTTTTISLRLTTIRLPISISRARRNHASTPAENPRRVPRGPLPGLERHRLRHGTGVLGFGPELPQGPRRGPRRATWRVIARARKDNETRRPRVRGRRHSRGPERDGFRIRRRVSSRGRRRTCRSTWDRARHKLILRRVMKVRDLGRRGGDERERRRQARAARRASADAERLVMGL